MNWSGGLEVGASVRTSPPRLAQAISLAIAVAALAGALLTSRGIEARAVARAETPQPIFFPRAEILRPALLGVHRLGGRPDLGSNRPVLRLTGRGRGAVPPALSVGGYDDLARPPFPGCLPVRRTVPHHRQAVSQRHRDLPEGHHRQSLGVATSARSRAVVLPGTRRITVRPCIGGRSRTTFPGARIISPVF